MTTAIDPTARLGYGRDLRVLLMDRGAQNLLVEIKPTSGEFNRAIDAAATATINGTISSVAENGDCSKWAQAAPWATEILILRDGRDAFAGPITDGIFGTKTVALTASDLSAWYERRRMKDLTIEATDAVHAFRLLHEHAMEDDPIPGFTIDATPAGALVAKKVYKAIEGKYVKDAMADLLTSHLDYTAYGRTIIVGPQEIPVSPYFTIKDDWWVTPPSVHERGNDQATQVVVTGKGIIAVATADKTYTDYYGLLTRIFNEPDTTDMKMLQASAQSKLDMLKDPVYIEPPQGSGLRPTAPVTLPELVPGIRVRVETSATCRKVTADFRLTNVKTDFKGLVAIDLAPIGTLAEV